MARPLVIVESPAKAKTIGRFLGNGYMVEASIGHIRDLPKSAAEIPDEHRGQAWARLGVDVEHDFAPLYVISDQKKEQVKRLKALLKEASTLYLATDEDREGESISWHLLDVLRPKIPVHRLVFHEITQQAIQKALASPRQVDQNLVRAQETRRVVDRLYGYEVSPLLWKKVRPKLSAGRVQSVAVRLLVERERARMAFRSGDWWDLEAKIDVDGGRFGAQLSEVDGKRVATGKDFDEATGQLAKKDVILLKGPQATQLAERVKGKSGKIAKVESKPYRETPAPPFTTSTLQQEANRKLRWSARRTMQLAQKLYENGWITYMRTDSVALSDQAIAAARDLIKNAYGAEYMPAVPRTYKNNAKNAQEAHEAIRPAGAAFRGLDEARNELDSDEARLYELIWKRTVACQMEDARGHRQLYLTQVDLPAVSGADATKLSFVATGKTIEFAGFRRAYVEGSDDPEAELADQERVLPAAKVGDSAKVREAGAREHHTQPPARLTEATLVKELESRGIGRPSTYASIIDTIIEREYVTRRGNTLIPTFTAFAVVKLMEQHLPGLVDYSFTARMEDELDEIALGTKDRLTTLSRFYSGEKGLIHVLKAAADGVDPRTVCTIPLGTHEGAEVVVRVGRYGPFVASGDATAPVPDDTAPDEATVPWAIEQLQKKSEGPRPLGDAPDGTPIFLMNGRFGPYVQRGEAKDKEKPPRSSLLPGMGLQDVDLEVALKLLSLPRSLGKDPASGEEVTATNGRFGPYVKKGNESRSIPAGISLLDIDLSQALPLFLEPARRTRSAPAPMREIGNTPAGKPIKLMSGRFGPYVSDGETNATLPKGMAPENLTLEEAVELLERRAAAGPSTKAKGRKKKAPDPMTARVVEPGENKPARTRKAAEKASNVEKVAKEPKKAPRKAATAAPAAPAPLSALPPAMADGPRGARSSGASAPKAPPKAKSPGKAPKKAAAPPPPPPPKMNNFITVKASTGKAAGSHEKPAEPIPALPPGLTRRR